MQAGPWPSRQEEAVTSKGEAKNGQKRNQEGESAHKETFLSRQRDSTLTAQRQLCRAWVLPSCPGWLGVLSTSSPVPARAGSNELLRLESTEGETSGCRSRWESMHAAKLWRSTSAWKTVE